MRTNAWLNAHKKLVWCTQSWAAVILYWIALSAVIITIRRLFARYPEAVQASLHLAVNTLGYMLALHMAPANAQDMTPWRRSFREARRGAVRRQCLDDQPGSTGAGSAATSTSSS